MYSFWSNQVFSFIKNLHFLIRSYAVAAILNFRRTNKASFLHGNLRNSLTMKHFRQLKVDVPEKQRLKIPANREAWLTYRVQPCWISKWNKNPKIISNVDDHQSSTCSRQNKPFAHLFHSITRNLLKWVYRRLTTTGDKDKLILVPRVDLWSSYAKSIIYGEVGCYPLKTYIKTTRYYGVILLCFVFCIFLFCFFVVFCVCVFYSVKLQQVKRLDFLQYSNSIILSCLSFAPFVVRDYDLCLLRWSDISRCSLILSVVWSLSILFRSVMWSLSLMFRSVMWFLPLLFCSLMWYLPLLCCSLVCSLSLMLCSLTWSLSLLFRSVCDICRCCFHCWCNRDRCCSIPPFCLDILLFRPLWLPCGLKWN